MQQNRALVCEFNAAGLQLRPQAAVRVQEFVDQFEESERESILEATVEYTKQYLRARSGNFNPVVDGDVIINVLDCMRKASANVGAAATTQEAADKGIEALDLGDGTYIYDVMKDVVPYDYSTSNKDWAPSPDKPCLFPSPEVKAKLFASRYYLLLQRLLLTGKFITEEESITSGISHGQQVLTKVESLQGNRGVKVVFGLISRIHSDGKREWTIEDLHKVYPLHLQMQELDHLVTDGCFVLARGSLQDGHFVVDALDTPKAMRREETLVKDLLPRQCFGGSLSNERLEILESYEAHKPDGFFVILSEVCLDNDRVIDKLTDLFQGYEESQPPCAYVIMGSFCSTPFVATGDGIKSYRDSFWQLKHLLLPLSNHVRCGTRFILLPGPNDPGAQTLPQAPLPPYLTADLAQEVPNVVFATNPCRIRHFSREMVFCRHDVMRHLRRHEVLPLRETDGGPASAAHSRNESVQLIFDQAHLVPLPLEHSSILWAYDHSLRLYPLPHAVFIGGVTPPFEVGYEGARFCSVGPFCRQAEFFAYHPIKDLMEPCGVHDRAG